MRTTRSSTKAVSAALTAMGLAATSAGLFVTAPAAVAVPSPAARETASRAATPSASYQVRYTDQAGHPLDGVQIVAFTVDSDAATSARTDSDGRAVLRLVPGHWEIEVGGQHITGGTSDATGYVGGSREVHVTAAKRIDGGTVALKPGGALRIHVTDTSGQPIPGVIPSLAPVEPYVQTDGDSSGAFGYGSGPGGQVVTGAAGTVVLKGVASDVANQVCAGSPFFSSGSTKSVYASACSQRARLARPGHIVDAPSLVLTRTVGGELSGRVRRSDGVPAAAFIAIERPSGAYVAVTSTGHAGSFLVGGLKPGRYRACALQGPFMRAGRTGFAPGCGAGITLRAGDHATSTITVHKGGALAGRVTGPHAVAVANVQVEADGGAGAGAETVTNRTGRYELKGLPTGAVRVCVDASNVTASKTLPTGVLSLCGRDAKHANASAGRLRSVPEAKLLAGGVLSGRVLDSGGRPVRGADVSANKLAKDGDPFDGLDVSDGITDRSGRYTIVGLPTGRYSLCVGSDAANSSGLDTCPNKTFAVRRSHRTTGVGLRVPATSTLAVSVVDTAGRPVAGVDAVAVRHCSRNCFGKFPLLLKQSIFVQATGITGGAGRVVFGGLRPGTYDVCLFGYYGSTREGSPATGYADTCADPKPVTVTRADHTTSKRVLLPDGGAVSGRITDAAGDPLKGVVVHVAGSAADDVPQDGFAGNGIPFSLAPIEFSRTAADGTFTVYGVRPGERLVCVDASHAKGGTSAGGYLDQCVGGTPGNSTKGTPVAVSADATTSGVDLALSPGAAVSGTLTAPLGKNDFGRSVVVFDDAKVVGFVNVGRSGTYKVSSMEAGTYEVCGAVFGSPDRGRCYRNVTWNPDLKSPPAGATAVTAQAGDDTSGVDVTVPK